MNTIWSDNIQGILNLDLSREMRFRDDRKELFLNLLGLKEGMTIADIGCGPGTVTRKLSKWLNSKSYIIGIDRDSKFINYAKEKAMINGLKNICYYEGDALKIPLDNNSVDACISHTVIEHVPNKEFLLEQKRVCRSNGRVTVMYARPDKYIITGMSKELEPTEREGELLDRLFIDSKKNNEQYGVGKYWPDSVSLLKLFEELGFKNVQVDAFAIPVAIDDARNSYEEKVAIVEAQKQQLFESVEIRLNMDGNKLTNEEVGELKQLISSRLAKRIDLIKEGTNIWDYTISIIQVVSGMVV